MHGQIQTTSLVPRPGNEAIQTTSLVPRPGNEAIQSTSMNTYCFLVNCKVSSWIRYINREIYASKKVLLTIKYLWPNSSSQLLYSIALNGYGNGLKHSTIITTWVCIEGRGGSMCWNWNNHSRGCFNWVISAVDAYCCCKTLTKL